MPVFALDVVVVENDYFSLLRDGSTYFLFAQCASGSIAISGGYSTSFGTVGPWPIFTRSGPVNRRWVIEIYAPDPGGSPSFDISIFALCTTGTETGP